MVLYFYPISLFAFLFTLFKGYLNKLRHKKAYALTLFGVCLISYVVLLLNYTDWLPGLTGDFWEITGHALCSLCGTIVYFYLFKFIEKYPFFKEISKLGSYSGPFYLVHVYIVRLLATYILRGDMTDSAYGAFVMFLTICFILGSLLITLFLCFIPYTDFLLFGNFRRIKDILHPQKWFINETQTIGHKDS